MPPHDACILDMGCGAGRDVTYLLVEGCRRSAAWRATAVDRWRAALDRAALLLRDNNLTEGPGAHADALLPMSVLDDGQVQLDGRRFAFADAPLPHAAYALILLIRFWHKPLLEALPVRTAPGTRVVLSHFVHAPEQIDVPHTATFAAYDSPPPSARIQPGDVDTLLAQWNERQSWHIIDNRIEPVEDGRPVQSVVLQRLQ